MRGRITILTVGSRGDVQPFLALSSGLMRSGYDVRIATNPEFASFVRENGVDFADLGPNPNEGFKRLMSPEGKAFRKIYMDLYVDWMRQWMSNGVRASEDADVVMVGPVATVGYDVAEKLGKPCVKLGYTPLTMTSEFTSSSLPRIRQVGPLLNTFSYAAIEEVSWWFARSIFNRLRRTVLDLPDAPWRSPEQRQRKQNLLTLYGVSPSIVPRPHDWPSNTHVTGYWFLKVKEDWQPPSDLVEFLASGPQPLFLDLGSLTVLVPEAVRNVLRGLVSTGHRVIADPHNADLSGVPLSERVYLTTDMVPHSWILPRVAAAISHGGPSTVAAIARAGVPALILPIFRDHSFWGSRLASVGVALKPLAARAVTSALMARAGKELITNQALRDRAARLGETIRSEDGVARAVEILERSFTGGR